MLLGAFGGSLLENLLTERLSWKNNNFLRKSIHAIVKIIQGTLPRPVLGIVIISVSFYVKNIVFLVISY